MTLYTKCKTQRQAISEAKQFSIEAARDNDCDWTEKVILMSGNTLHITSTPSGIITMSETSGWDRDGHIFCGPKAYAVAQ